MYVDLKTKEIEYNNIKFSCYDEQNGVEWADEQKENHSTMAIEQCGNALNFTNKERIEKIKNAYNNKDWEYNSHYGWIALIKNNEVDEIYPLYNDLGWGETLDMDDLTEDEIQYVKDIVEIYFKKE